MNAALWQSDWAVFGGLVAAEAALIGAVAWLVQARMKTAFARSLVWQSALLAVFAVTMVELAGAGPALLRSLRAEVAVEAPPVVEAEPALIPPLATEGMMRVEGGNPLIRELVAQKLAEKEAALEPGLEIGAQPTAAPVATVQPRIPIEWAWGAGTLALLALLGLRRAGFWLCSLRFKKTDCPQLLARIRAVAERLGMRSVARALTSKRLATPVAFGLLRPTVGLPDDFESANTDARKDAMLAHELAHLRARDPWWHLGADLMVALFWWHPIAWWIARQLKQASETAADEASACVENGPEALAECLVDFGKQFAKGSPANAIGMAGDGYRSRLGNRVEALLRMPVDLGVRNGIEFATLRRIGAAVGLACGGLLLVACCAPDSAGDVEAPLAKARQALTPSVETVAETPVKKDDSLRVAVEYRIADVQQKGTGGISYRTPVDGEPPPPLLRALSETNASPYPERLPPPETIWTALTGILTDPQTKVVLHALENRDGVTVRTAPSTILRGNDPVWFVSKTADLVGAPSTRADELKATLRDDGRGIAISVRRSQASPVAGLSKSEVRPTDTQPSGSDVKTSSEAVVADGHTLVLHGSIPGQDTNVNQIVFATFRIVDAAGQPVNEQPTDLSAASPHQLIEESGVSSSGGGHQASKQVQAEVAELTRDGVYLYELEMYDGAKQKFQQAIELDKDNQVARRHLGLIQEIERANERSGVDGLPFKSASLPDVNPSFRTNTVPVDGRPTKVFTKVFKLEHRMIEVNLRRRFPDLLKSADFSNGIRALLSAEGVSLDATNQVFYNDRNGVLMMRATPKELKAAQSVVERWIAPEYCGKDRNVAHLIEDGKMLYANRLLDEAERKLRKAIEQDPKAKAAFYYLARVQEAMYGYERRAREATQKERLLDVERAWNDGLPLKSTTLPEPAPYFRTNSVPQDGLVTRVFKVDPKTFPEKLKALKPAPKLAGRVGPTDGGQRASTGTNEVSGIAQAIRRLLTAAGVSTNPPPQVFYKDRDGRLMVRAKPIDLEAIASVVELLNAKPSEQEAGSAERLVERGRAHYEARRLEEAKAALKKALKLEPTHQLAAYYLALVEHAEQRRAPESSIVANDLSEQLRGRHFRTNAVNRTSVRRQQIGSAIFFL